MKTIICSAFILICSLFGNPEIRKEGMVFKEFTLGTVQFKDGSRINAMLNYDSFEEQMIFKEKDKVMALANPSTINWVEIQDRTFVWYENDIFLEQIDTAGITLFKRHRNQARSKGKETSYGVVSQTSSVDNVNSLARGYDKQSSDLVNKEEFELKKDDLFYVKIDDQYQNLANTKQFSKVYKTNRKSTEQFVKKESLDLMNLADVVRLIQFCQK